jgi:nucleoside-diphosphate-sugar epimerase
MRILFTAAGGFVGSFLTRQFSDLGHDVHALIRRPRASGGGAKVTLHEADITAPLRVSLPAVADLIVHNAAVINAADPQDFERVNVVGAANVIDWALRAGISKIVFLSGLSAYGRVSVPMVDEATLPQEPAPYGLSKLKAEALLAEAAGKGISSLILRLPGLLGPGCQGAWLARIADQAMAGAPIEVFNGNAPFNNAVWLADLGTFILDAIGRMEPGASILTLGAGQPLTISETVAVMIEAMQSRSRVTDRGARDGAFWISNAKAERDFGYRPRGMKDIAIALAHDRVGHHVHEQRAKA